MTQYSLPEYPRTPHLPYRPNPIGDDIVAESDDVQSILNNSDVFIFEKIDGANAAILFDGENFTIRNRSNFLQKGYLKNTPAKIQFRSIWNWAYENKKKFQKLNEIFYGPVGVYGEWSWALHAIRYDQLPDYFISFDIWDPEKRIFIKIDQAYNALIESGFSVAPMIAKGPFNSFTELDELTKLNSQFSSTDKSEGIYIKENNEYTINKRFKLLREDYIQGSGWSDDIIKQKLKS